MRTRFSLVILVLVLSVWPLQAVGTVTRTEHLVIGNVERFTFTAVSDASGDVNDNAITVSATPSVVGSGANTIGSGRLIQVTIDPDGGGTQPSDDFDFTVVDANGVDVLNGVGGDTDNTVGEYFLGDPPVFLSPGSTLDFVLANLGNAKGVTITVLVERP